MCAFQCLTAYTTACGKSARLYSSIASANYSDNPADPAPRRAGSNRTVTARVMILLQMLTDKPGFICTVMSCAASGALATSGNGNACADVPDNSVQYCRRHRRAQWSPFRIDTVQHALDGGRWCQGQASSSNALHLPISRIARRYPSTERWHTAPTQSPAHYAGVLHRIAGGILHHAQRMIRQEILSKRFSS